MPVKKEGASQRKAMYVPCEDVRMMIKMKVAEDSMLIWFPKIKNLPIPQPKTVMLPLNDIEIGQFLKSMDGGELPETVLKRMDNALESFRFPVFIRTDLASGKHDWKKSCFCESRDELSSHIYCVIEFQYLADILGLPYRALVMREFIPMDTRFTAFYGEMPVNPERRYFVKDGNVVCHHPYWISESIVNPSTPDWLELAKEMNIETPSEIAFLTEYAKMVSRAVPGFWSVDFCKGMDGKWWLIDMATAEMSWHHEGCPHRPDVSPQIGIGTDMVEIEIAEGIMK